MALMANGVMRMAQYRTLKMDFWSDPFIEDLPYMGKYVYLYLITSPHTNNLGILDISRKKIAYETGMTVKMSKHKSKIYGRRGNCSLMGRQFCSSTSSRTRHTTPRT